MQSKVDMFLSKATQVRVTEGYRSQERQNELYTQGRTTPWPIVTWTLNSNHTKGTAIDIAFRWTDPYPNDHSKWEEVANIAISYWLNWGYAMWWLDKPHFEDNGIPLNMPPTDDQKAVQKRIDQFLSAYEITDVGMDEPISKRNVITILSLVDLEHAKEIKGLRDRISKLEDEMTQAKK